MVLRRADEKQRCIGAQAMRFRQRRHVVMNCAWPFCASRYTTGVFFQTIFPGGKNGAGGNEEEQARRETKGGNFSKSRSIKRAVQTKEQNRTEINPAKRHLPKINPAKKQPT
ncbi:hypothetical protein GLAREA_10092 [Glarea lozoyensis ATCC 20868]|uniref:Uncharacterized protein n=1 Tax=Glarea lozoyensis (strain ATCC 20868 / MF5171) TaxID=1116229 RepID=S3E7T8_GLAL2|nr:uncharacterized protein GLAREA_10092 [Glarea lozoyensis ATCC 20868]EPE34398.1 hypothetical protein GLAREA_10092 [Glarea lozoyensis ATCC 20868]